MGAGKPGTVSVAYRMSSMCAFIASWIVIWIGIAPYSVEPVADLLGSSRHGASSPNSNVPSSPAIPKTPVGLERINTAASSENHFRAGDRVNLFVFMIVWQVLESAAHLSIRKNLDTISR